MAGFGIAATGEAANVNSRWLATALAPDRAAYRLRSVVRRDDTELRTWMLGKAETATTDS
jgi:hypothetical protein